MARRRKPTDPGDAQEKADRKAELQRLKAMGASVTQDRGGRVVSARLSNVFNLLLARGTITQNHHDAACYLASDWAAWKGLDGRPESTPIHVDGGRGCREIVTDRMIKGGREVAKALKDVDPISRMILEAFMVATVEEDRPMAWRGILERLGVTVRNRQAQAMVEALGALDRHYREPRRMVA